MRGELLFSFWPSWLLFCGSGPIARRFNLATPRYSRQGAHAHFLFQDRGRHLRRYFSRDHASPRNLRNRAVRHCYDCAHRTPRQKISSCSLHRLRGFSRPPHFQGVSLARFCGRENGVVLDFLLNISKALKRYAQSHICKHYLVGGGNGRAHWEHRLLVLLRSSGNKPGRWRLCLVHEFQRRDHSIFTSGSLLYRRVACLDNWQSYPLRFDRNITACMRWRILKDTPRLTAITLVAPGVRFGRRSCDPALKGCIAVLATNAYQT